MEFGSLSAICCSLVAPNVTQVASMVIILIFFVSFRNIWKKKNYTHLFFSVMIISSRIAACQRKLQQIVTDCFYGRFCAEHKVVRSPCEKDSAARRLRVLRTRWETLRDLTTKEKRSRGKKRKTSTEEDRPKCLPPHGASARTVATTFKFSVCLGLVGIFFIFKPSHEMLYISIVTSLLRSSSHFRLRSGYFSKRLPFM